MVYKFKYLWSKISPQYFRISKKKSIKLKIRVYFKRYIYQFSHLEVKRGIFSFLPAKALTVITLDSSNFKADSNQRQYQDNYQTKKKKKMISKVKKKTD